MRPVAELRDEVVKGDDGTGKVEWGIEGVCEVIAEGKVGRFCRYSYTVSFREIGGIELLLLGVISLIEDGDGEMERNSPLESCRFWN